MEKPKFAPNQMYKIMRNCWHADALQRPDFNDLEDQLGDQLELAIRRHYIELNEYYVLNNNQKSASSPDYLNMVRSADYVNVDRANSHYVNTAM